MVTKTARDKMDPWSEQWSLQTCLPITSRALQLRDVTYSPVRLPPFFTEKSVAEDVCHLF